MSSLSEERPAVRRVELRLGGRPLPLHLEDGGSGPADGTPMLFLHGWLRSAREWNRLAPGFRGLLRCVAVDLPGCGRSGAPRAPYDLPWLAGAVLSLMDRLELPRVRLFTHGLGGAVGLRLSIDHPERVEAHVAVSPSTWRNPLAGLRSRALALAPVGIPALSLLRSRRVLRRVLQGRPYHESIRVTPELLDEIRADLRRPGALAAARALLLTDLDPGLGPDLAGISVPTTLVWGQCDAVNLVDLGRRLEAEVAAVSLRTIPNTGYMCIEERPLSVAIHACAALGLPRPEGVPDGHPTPAEGDFS